MATTITTANNQEVYLVNIMSVAEERLQSNFRMIMERLSDHDRMFEEQNKIMMSNREQAIMGRREN